MVVAIWAKNKSASGRVASDLVLDKVIPTKADDASKRDVPVMSIAWLNERRITLCFIFCGAWGGTLFIRPSVNIY
jgi:hypothetical protein